MLSRYIISAIIFNLNMRISTAIIVAKRILQWDLAVFLYV